MAAAIALGCPECREELEVPIEARLEDDNLVLDPDLSQVWLHVWAEHPEAVA